MFNKHDKGQEGMKSKLSTCRVTFLVLCLFFFLLFPQPQSHTSSLQPLYLYCTSLLISFSPSSVISVHNPYTGVIEKHNYSLCRLTSKERKTIISKLHLLNKEKELSKDKSKITTNNDKIQAVEEDINKVIRTVTRWCGRSGGGGGGAQSEGKTKTNIKYQSYY